MYTLLPNEENCFMFYLGIVSVFMETSTLKCMLL